MGKHYTKILCGGILLLTVVLFFVSDLHTVLTFENIKASRAEFAALYADRPLLVIACYIAIYLPCIALSLPGATLLGLAAGALFGTITGTIVVSFASTAGATIACALARYMLQDFVQARFGDKLEGVHRGIAREGHYYLFSMRLIPVIPFFAINLLMGLTRIPLRTFAWVSQLGMLPGTFVYINAGSQIASLDSVEGIFSAKLLLSFALLGVFPILSRKLLLMFKTKRFNNAMQPSEAMQSGGNMGADLKKTAMAISSGCRECGACLQSCGYLQVYGSPKLIASQLLNKDGLGRLTAFECSLCNLCGAVCPEKLSPVEMFLNMRRDAQRAGEVDSKIHAPLLGYEKKGSSPHFSLYALPKNCDTVFFPGCTFPGTRPQTAWAIFNYFRDNIPGVGVVLDCCNKPSHDLGRHDQFLEKFKTMNKYLVDNGIRKVLVACPNCFNILMKYGQNLEILSVYEMIVEYGLPATPKVAEQCVLHDPCPLRNQPQVHNAIRSLTAEKGIALDELKSRTSRTLCCGEGGGVGFVRPEFAKKWGQLRADQSAGQKILTYCAGCANFLCRYTTVWHVLDLVFFPLEVTAGRFSTVKAPFTYLQRLIYKKKLCKLLAVEADHNSQKGIVPAISSHRGILGYRKHFWLSTGLIVFLVLATSAYFIH